MLRTAFLALLTLFTSVWVTILFVDWRNRGPGELTVIRSTLEAIPPPTEIPAPSTAKLPDQTSLKAVLPRSPSSSFIAPKLMKRVEPQYTAYALSRKLEGKVTLSFFVMPTGHVRTIPVLHRLDASLDRKAIEAVSRWRYSSALKNGQPTTVRLTEEIEFRLP